MYKGDADENDADLVKAAKCGDPHAFSQLIELHAARAYRLAFAILGNRSDAEDAVQEACTRAHRSLKQLRQDESFRVWFARIVANCSRNSLRRQRRRRGLVSYVPLDETTHSSPTEDEVSSLEALIDLHCALSRLPEEHRLVIVLHYVEEMTTREIAYTIGRPEGTVRRLLSESYVKLRIYLGGPK
jgi:RNA polymerase sigma-70 factor (ECF subfamily)